MRALSFGWMLLGLAAPGAAAQVPNLDDGIPWVRYSMLRAWTVENGLPQNSVHAIEQTQDGALWLATHGGLARFDGRGFQVFNEGNVPELGSSYFCGLLEDRSGRLWIGTAHGRIVLREGRTFRAFATAEGAPGGEIWGLAETGDGTIVAAGHGELARFDGQGFTSLLDDGAPRPGRITRLLAHEDGSLWCAAGNGLYRVRDGRCERVELADGGTYASASYVDRLADGALWAKTDRGLARIVDGRLRLLEHRGAETGWGVTSAVQLADRSLFLATDEGLLNVAFFGDVARFAPHAMETLDARALYLDREDSLWIGTLTRGLLQQVRTPSVSLTCAELGLREGNLALAAAGAEEAWVGSREGGRITRLNARTGQVTGVEAVTRGSRRVLGLLSARDGALWVQHELGLQRILAGSTQDFELPCEAYQAPLLEDARGAVWAGGRASLACVHGGEVQLYGVAEGLREDESVESLAESPDDSIWAGTSAGLAHLVDGRFERYGREQGLPGGAVRALLALPDGTLWIGTYGGGLARLAAGRVARVEAAHGLYSDAISRIEHDGQGTLWINSNRGVFRVALAELEEVAAGRSGSVACLGLRTGESGGRGGVRLSSGRMLFAAVDGLTLIDPALVRTPAVPPHVELVALVADGQGFDPGERALVPPGPRELVFRYTGISLAEPVALRFRYRLVGFDEVWRDAGDATGARYTNVPPGSYRFEVLARSHDGTWSAAPAAMELELRPHLHERLWFQVGAALAAAALVLWGFDRRARTALRRQRALQIEVDRRKAAEDSLRHLTGRLIQAQEEERKRVALELHDDLGQRLALLGVGLDVLAQDRGAGNGAAAEHLRTLADSVHSISRDVHGMSHRLHSTKLDKLGLEAALSSLCRELAEQHQIAIDFSAAGDVSAIGPAPALALYRVAQESVRNAIRHSEASAIQVELDCADRSATLRVRDDGQGFDLEAARAREGLGLQGMEERMRMLGGGLRIESQAGLGTRLEARVPLDRPRA